TRTSTANNNINQVPAPQGVSDITNTSNATTPSGRPRATPSTTNAVTTTNITPTFTQIGPLCQNSTAPALPTTSNNNITGTWNPAVISTSTSGTITYTFTPTAGQCATTATIDIVITNQITTASPRIWPLWQNL